uniref:H15 domain-containing protein n=1 Tax=Felis catus TaxID=9685 RepID=A0ABI7YWK2_FELCA
GNQEQRLTSPTEERLRGDFRPPPWRSLRLVPFTRPRERCKKNTSLPPTSPPLASNALQGAGRQASPSGTPSESETGCPDSPKVHQKPSISKVILGVVTHKGAHRHVTLTTLKKAVATAGYNMTQNAWRFKRAVKGLVDKGMLKQVTGKGALGSFRIGNKYASKVKGRSQSRRQSGQRRSGQRSSGQRRAGQRRPGQRRLQAGRGARPAKGSVQWK